MDYGKELERLRFTKKQTEFLTRYWIEAKGVLEEEDEDSSLPNGVIPAGVSMCGEREGCTRVLNVLVKKGVIAFDHEGMCTEVTFLINTPVPGVYMPQ